MVTACVEPPTQGNRATSGDLNVLVCLRGARNDLLEHPGAKGAGRSGGCVRVPKVPQVRRVALPPKGQQVPQGGQAGPAGAAGIVNATFDADTPGTTAAVPTNFADFLGGSLIRDLTLPAGSYDITATSSVRGAADGPAAPALNTRIRCNLVDPTAGVELDTFYDDFFQPDEPSPGFREALQVGALTTFAVPTKVELRCYSIRPAPERYRGSFSSSKLIATEVATTTAGH